MLARTRLAAGAEFCDPRSRLGPTGGLKISKRPAGRWCKPGPGRLGRAERWVSPCGACLDESVVLPVADGRGASQTPPNHAGRQDPTTYEDDRKAHVSPRPPYPCRRPSHVTLTECRLLPLAPVWVPVGCRNIARGRRKLIPTVVEDFGRVFVRVALRRRDDHRHAMRQNSSRGRPPSGPRARSVPPEVAASPGAPRSSRSPPAVTGRASPRAPVPTAIANTVFEIGHSTYRDVGGEI